jgi:hypothetical protein
VTVQKLSPSQRALAEVLQRRRAAAASGGPGPRDRSEPVPLSSSQLRIWFLQQWQPDAPTFNAVRAFRLRGPLDAGALQQALAGLMERHEALRTVFVSEGGAEPQQVVLDHDGIELPLVDLSELEPQAREERLSTLLRELCREPFDLAADRMLRTTLVRLAADEHVLVMRMHHIAGDAASTGVMSRELGELYSAATEGRPHALGAPPLGFADVAVWQRRRLQGRLLDDLTDYWVRQLEGAPALLALPTDRPRREVQRHEGAHRRFTLEQPLADRIDELAREERATMYIVTLAAFAVLLYRVGGEDDVVIGSPIANRTHAELAGVVGFLSNTVALRVRLDGNPSFREVVQRAREAVLGALAHQEMPFEQVVSALRLPRDAGHNPVFQVNFRAQAEQPPVPDMAGLTATTVPVDIGFSRFDLALELQRAADGLEGYMEYDLDLFDGSTIDALVAALHQLLDQVLGDPDISVLAVAVPSLQRPRGRPGPTRGRRRADYGEPGNE